MSNTDFEGEDELVEEIIDDPVDDVSDEEEVLSVDAEDDGLDEEMVEEVDDRPSREEARIEALRTRSEQNAVAAAEERVRREMLERQIAETRQREDPAFEAERLALMTPEERADYKLNKALGEMDLRAKREAFRIEDIADRAAFEAKVSSDPLYARFADKVEAQLAELRRQNQNIGRERLFKYLVGEHVLASRGQRNTSDAPRRNQNVDRQRTQSVRGRTDTQVGRRETSDTPAKRLNGVLI